MPRIEHDGVSVELNLIPYILKIKEKMIGFYLHTTPEECYAPDKLFCFDSVYKRDEYWDKYIKPLSQWGV